MLASASVRFVENAVGSVVFLILSSYSTIFCFCACLFLLIFLDLASILFKCMFCFAYNTLHMVPKALIGLAVVTVKTDGWVFTFRL